MNRLIFSWKFGLCLSYIINMSKVKCKEGYHIQTKKMDLKICVRIRRAIWGINIQFSIDDAQYLWYLCRRRHQSAAAHNPRDLSQRHESAPSIRPATRIHHRTLSAIAHKSRQNRLAKDFKWGEHAAINKINGIFSRNVWKLVKNAWCKSVKSHVADYGQITRIM